MKPSLAFRHRAISLLVQWGRICWCSMALLPIFSFTQTSAQNIVDQASNHLAANPAKLTEMDFSGFLLYAPSYQTTPTPEALRTQAKLEAHVSQFIQGFPWKPFQHTIGISGYELYYDHPGHVFYSLSLARPYLAPATVVKAQQLLQSLLSNSPPWAVEGFERAQGNARESYDVPGALRLKGRGSASSAFGVYAFWLYCHSFNDQASARAYWKNVSLRMQPLLAGNYQFDVRKKDYTRDEAQKLNGDLAGLLGLVRLARLNADEVTEKQAAAKARELLQLRVDLERVNPHILERSSASTKHLHYYKLARFCELVPEVAEAVRNLSAGCGAARLKTFREERNGWFIAYGDRWIGGENYTSPPHFAQSLFAGAALIEHLPAPQLLSFVDVPWCKGDLFFIQKCSYALWSASGRHWTKLP